MVDSIGHVVYDDLDLEKFGRMIGVLKAFEEVFIEAPAHQFGVGRPKGDRGGFRCLSELLTAVARLPAQCPAGWRLRTLLEGGRRARPPGAPFVWGYPSMLPPGNPHVCATHAAETRALRVTLIPRQPRLQLVKGGAP